MSVIDNNNNQDNNDNENKNTYCLTLLIYILRIITYIST